MKKNSAKIIASGLMILSICNAGSASAESVEQAQAQVDKLTKQSEELIKKKESLIADNKRYQEELLQTQKDLVKQKKKMANFVHNVQASDMNQGYIKMVMSSKNIKEMIQNIAVANNFARVNQSNAKTLEDTAKKLGGLAEKNNTIIANITRQEKSIKKTLEAKEQLINNIEKAEINEEQEVATVEVPEPEKLSPEPDLANEKMSNVNVEEIIAGSPLVTPSAEEEGAGEGDGTSSQGTPIPTPAPAPPPVEPNIKFVKMPSDGIGFDGGQCTYGADSLLGGDVPNWWGNAVNWFGNAKAQGLPTGSTPVAGALVVYGANANIGGYLTGYQGHVGVVQSVQGSNIVVKEMNGTAGEWKYNVRTGSSTSGVIGYIYIK